MGHSVTLGGDRLGSGNKQKIQLKGFERSTHDLGYVWRNTQAPGTLVPFMNILALPGDSFDINLGADVKTHPTIGPLFASMKLQLDVFQCPIRLYHSWLHNNKLKIGNDMSKVKLPYLNLMVNPLNLMPYSITNPYEYTVPLEMQQINQSSLLAYLGIRGIGQGDVGKVNAEKNAIPYLAFWDIYKNYYANKQEEIGMFIHTEENKHIPMTIGIYKGTIETENLIYSGTGLNIYSYQTPVIMEPATIYWYRISILKSDQAEFNLHNSVNTWFRYPLSEDRKYYIEKLSFENTSIPTDSGNYAIYDVSLLLGNAIDASITGVTIGPAITLAESQNQINIQQFPLSNIDEMRELILSHDGTDPYDINSAQLSPYSDPLSKTNAPDTLGQICSYYSQEGLPLKTYQSDIFNNWLNTEWIDGEGGINEITAVDTSGGSFDINTLNLAQKVYDMLNRIAVSGGSYDDWMEAVYDNNGYRKCETPMYMGGLSKEIIFQEVISTSQSLKTKDGVPEIGDPLGTLAGKGGLSKKHKGGSVSIKVTEPSFIIGIVSITPRIDYSQGNDWTTLIKTMDDLHKPNLDEIGFQELITDQMAFWDTQVSDGVYTFSSAGKQPAWLNYMTNYNKLYGNFADPRNEMYMTLARRYTPDELTGKIKDLTSYIDPMKFNYAFAETDLTAQNFWVQIGCDITARRKLSAKLMPNL